jgi:hypothetical protein
MEIYSIRILHQAENLMFLRMSNVEIFEIVPHH